MRINSYLLKIIINTNLPGNNQDKMEFKRSMIYHPELKESPFVLGDYPYFSDNVKYPIDKLKALSYSDIVYFFFNQRQFNQVLKNETVISSDNANFNEINKDIVNCNIMSMILLLFPTVFPFEDDYAASYELITGTEKMKPFFKNPFSASSSRYSYFKINNTVFTIKSIIWINDLINHPFYETLLEETNSIRDLVKKKMKQSIEGGNKINAEILNTLNVCLEKMYEGCRLSLLKIPLETDAAKISMGKETSLFFQNILKLQFLFLSSQGTQKTDIIPYQLETMKKNLEAVSKSDTILRTLTGCINNNSSISVGNDFSSQQTILTNTIEDVCSKPPRALRSFILVNSNNSIEKSDLQINRLLLEINAAMNDKICSKADLIEKQRADYDAVQVMLKGDKINSALSSEESIKKKYEYFKSFILKKYKAPSRETSNIYLQSLINSVSEGAGSEEAITNYFKYFNKVFDYYIDNYGEKPNEKEMELLNVGVCSINMDSKTAPHREIHILMDFIDGEINAGNKSAIFCPFTSEYLGNQFEKLMENNEKANLLWSIDDDDRSIFKVGNLTTTNKSKASPGQNLELIEEKPNRNVLQPPPREQMNNIDNGDLITWLTIDILPTDQKAVLESIEKMNKVRAQQLEKEDLVDFIMKNGAELYGIMKKMFSNKDKFSSDVVQYLIGLQGKYETSIKQNDNLLKTKYAMVNFNVDEKEKNKLIYTNEMLQLFVLVVGYLLDFERKKQATKGGKKKLAKRGKKHFTIKKTKKHYYIMKPRKTVKLH